MLTKEQILAMCDHTVLRPEAEFSEIVDNCRLAQRFNCASMCLAPSFVRPVREMFGDSLRITTVVGFPNGYNDTATKAFEALHLINEGADEIDAVINIGWAREGNYKDLAEELRRLRRQTQDHVLKIIVETCKLPIPVLREVCRLVSDSGADFIKTSTGFAERGASVDDIRIMREECDPRVKIKAAGGIRTFEDAQALIDAGADRLGTSRLVSLMLPDITLKPENEKKKR
ncbi:MAG: deoxyribose-phosphate aldolase [Oscillospiraceae bacterium]|jgi:deoxyribose-phosphate aldolase